MRVSTLTPFATTFLIAASVAHADTSLIYDITGHFKSQPSAEMIELMPDFFKETAAIDCRGFTEHAGLIVNALQNGAFLEDLRSIDEGIGRPTFVHDFVGRHLEENRGELTALLGAEMITDVSESCAQAVEATMKGN